MRILVLYSTVEGHTGKIAETISNWLETAGYETALTRPDQVGYLDPANFDAVFGED